MILHALSQLAIAATITLAGIIVLGALIGLLIARYPDRIAKPHIRDHNPQPDPDRIDRRQS